MLSASLKSTLNRQGFAGPLPLQDPDRATRALAVYPSLTSQRNQHVVSSEIADLLVDPALVEAVEMLCGDDLVVWRSAFFSKSKGSAEIGWHHDKHYQTAESTVVSFDELEQHFSVLITLSGITRQTGQLEVIPGSHLEDDRYRRDRRPYHLRPAKDHFLSDIPASLLETRHGVDIPSAHFLLFHSALLHRSLPHPGGPPRLGLAFRLARRGARVPKELASTADTVPFGLPRFHR